MINVLQVTFPTRSDAIQVYLPNGVPLGILELDESAGTVVWTDAISARTSTIGVIPTPYTCEACGRPEDECSAEPCAAVVRDREATV